MNGPPMPLGAIGVMNKFRKLAKASSERATTKFSSQTSQDTYEIFSKEGHRTSSKDTYQITAPETHEISCQKTRNQAFQDDIRKLELAGIVVPNPCFRPLEHKLAPRDELRVGSPRSLFSSGSVGSPNADDRHRGHVSSSLSGSTTLESPQEEQRRCDTSMPRKKKLADEESKISYPTRQQSMDNFNHRKSKSNETSTNPRQSFDPEEQRRKAELDEGKSRNIEHRRYKPTTSATSKKVPRLTSVRGKRQSLHTMAVANFLGDGDQRKIDQWTQYLEHYSMGEYNISNPPAPNMLNSDFEYLPAVFPQNEITRMSIYRAYEAIWPVHGAKAGKSLVKEAAEFFGVDFAMISFFDESRELCKVQWGLDSDGIFGRPISITAHCLYTMDVLTVLNTRLDWRFKNNPWCEQWPEARFFAAAPMMAGDQIIGAFTILDKVSHAAFSYADRQKLVEFSDRAMAGMNKQYAWNTQSEEDRLTPLLERDSRIYGTFEPQSASSSSRLSTPMVLLKQISRVSIAPFAKANDYTPPSSSEENRVFGETAGQVHAIVTPQQREQATPATPVSQQYSASDLTPLTENSPSPIFLRDNRHQNNPLEEVTVQNFWSLDDRDVCERSILEPDDDIGQVRGNMLRKPAASRHQEESLPGKEAEYRERSSYERKVSEEMPCEGEDSYEDGEGIVKHCANQGDYESKQTSLHGSADRDSAKSMKTCDSLSDDYQHPPHPGPPPSIPPPPLPRNNRPSATYSAFPSLSKTPPTRTLLKKTSASNIYSSPPSPSTMATCNLHSYGHSSSTYFANATAICANIAQSLTYDLVYLVELKAVCTKYKDDSELLLDRQLRTKVLARYPLGDTSPLTVSVDHHLEALRKTVSIFLGNDRGRAGENEVLGGYEFGVLVSLGTPGPSRVRTDGIVLGAFRFVKALPPSRSVSGSVRPRRSGDGEGEVEKLREAVLKVGLEVLLKGEEERTIAVRGERKLKERSSEVERLKEGKGVGAKGAIKQEGKRETYVPDVMERSVLLGRYPAGRERPLGAGAEKKG